MNTKSIKLAFLIFTFSVFSFQFSFAQMFWNRACQFAGNTSSYIAVPNSGSINLTGSFTIEAWINPSSASGSKGIVAKGGSLGTALEYGMRVLSDGRFFVTTDGAVRLMSKTNTKITANQWSHVAATYNSSTDTFALYFNGVLDTLSKIAGAAPPANTDSLFIGISGATTPFPGQMDELRLWSRALSPTEVNQYFRTTLAARSGIYSGLVMSLPFQGNNASGSFTLFDASGNGNNGINRGVTEVDQSNRPYVTIMPNESVELDGSEDYLAGADDNIFSPTLVITMEAWVYPRSADPFIIITKGTNYRLSFDGVFVNFGINNVFHNTGVGLPINQWSHVALSYSSFTGSASFSLNGILFPPIAVNLGSINNGTDSLYIGGGPAGLADLNGYIDEVRISHYFKSSTIINRFLYQSIDDSNQPDPLILQAAFSFDGIASSGSDGAPVLQFRNNARFSHPGAISGQPISPLERTEKLNFSNGYYIKTSNKKIPLSGTIIDSTTVNLNSTISDLNFFVALNHTNSANLEIVLVAPNGDSVKVFNNKSTRSLDENLITIFDDQADSGLIDNRYASFLPKIRPENNMNSIFNGDNSQGTWKIIVRDEVINDSGFLYAWGIQFNIMRQRPKDLNVSALIQGFYNPVTDFMVPDTMRVHLRNFVSPFAIIDSSKEVLNSSGLGLFSFAGNVNNNLNYHVQLKHRNSIETWSTLFIFVNDEASYSFLNAAGAAFGANQIQVDNSPVRFAIYGGDVNQDGIVDASDVSLIDNDAANFVTGYVIKDITGNDFVDASDLSIADNNAFNFVMKIVP